MEDELTVSQAVTEFGMKRPTINSYILKGRLKAEKRYSELGTPYWVFTRQALCQLLASLPAKARHPERTR